MRHPKKMFMVRLILQRPDESAYLIQTGDDTARVIEKVEGVWTLHAPRGLRSQYREGKWLGLKNRAAARKAWAAAKELGQASREKLEPISEKNTQV